MRHIFRLTALCALSAGLSLAHAEQAAETSAPAQAPVTSKVTLTLSKEAPRPSSRLKYRKGPVCMCDGGLSEADIAAAQSRVEAPATPASDAAPVKE